MKRFTPVLAALVFPVSFAFALTARPAVLYAESSAPIDCSASSPTCAGKAASSACTTSAGKAGTCTATRCASPDGGAGSSLVCLETATTTPTPGKTIPEETTDETPSTTPKDDDGGCALSKARGAASPGFAGAGLAIAALAFSRRARRRR